MLGLVRVDTMNTSAKVGVSEEEVRPRHEDRRELLAAADVQKSGLEAGLLDAVALVVRIVLG